MSSFVGLHGKLVPKGKAQNQGAAHRLPKGHVLAEEGNRNQHRHERVDVAEHRRLLPGQLFEGGKIHAVGHTRVDNAHRQQAQPAFAVHAAEKALLSAGISGSEIDLIVADRNFLVFVEVKLRKNDRFASAMEFVDRNKQNRIRTTAEVYLSQNPTDLQPRFDVIEIYAPDGVDTKKPEIHHLEDAFA